MGESHNNGTKKLPTAIDNVDKIHCTPSCCFQKDDGLFSSEQRPSQWEHLLASVSVEQNLQHKPTHLIYPTIHRAKKLFPTGSQYEGTWDVLGMSGSGTYTYPHGVIYEGEFNDGTFHGYGVLKYPNGIILKGRFCRGVMIERTIVFSDGVEFMDGEWHYAKMPDRRFSCEFKGLLPAGRSIMTASQPPHDIPDGYYDTEDGLYDPKNKSVFKYDDITCMIRTVKEREHNWILDNCRKAPMGPMGAEPALYEEWSEPVPDTTKDLKPAKKTFVQQSMQSENRIDDMEINNEVEITYKFFISSESSNDSESQ